MGVTKDGIEGEQWALKWLKKRGYKVFQSDVIAEKNGKYYVFEVKHQERFKAPPFDGHGLPPYQVKARLDFQKSTGVDAVLLIREKGEDKIYIQRLDELEKGDSFVTQVNPRKVYSINSFYSTNGTQTLT